MKKIMVAAAAALSTAVLFAPAAHADVTVCDYLDANPTPAGVLDVIAMGIYGNGMTPEQTAEFIRQEIVAYCPRHLFTVQAAIDAYGLSGGTQYT